MSSQQSQSNAQTAGTAPQSQPQQGQSPHATAADQANGPQTRTESLATAGPARPPTGLKRHYAVAFIDPNKWYPTS